MGERRIKSPPRWFFSILTVGAFVACGINLWTWAERLGVKDLLDQVKKQ